MVGVAATASHTRKIMQKKKKKKMKKAGTLLIRLFHCKQMEKSSQLTLLWGLYASFPSEHAKICAAYNNTKKAEIWQSDS